MLSLQCLPSRPPKPMSSTIPQGTSHTEQHVLGSRFRPLQDPTDALVHEFLLHSVGLTHQFVEPILEKRVIIAI